MHAHLRADAKILQVLLRQGEVDVDRVHGLQRHDGVAAVEVLANVDPADAQHAVEAGADGLALDGGLGVGDGGLGLPLVGVGGVEIALRIRVLFAQVLLTLERVHREVAVRLGGFERRLFLVGDQTHEQVALADGLAALEQDVLDDARQVGGDRHALHGFERADGAQGRLPLGRVDDVGGHGDGRR